MTIVERNDVDVARLFIWGKQFDIKDNEDNVKATVYMRLLGDADVNRARVFALRKSRELRLKFNDPNSDESLIYLRGIDEMTEKELIEYVVVFSMREITNRAYKQVKVEKPKMPKSDAPLKKMEKFQKEVDDYPAKLDTAIKDYIKSEVDKMRERLATEDKESLYKQYKENLVNEFCEQEALRSYRDMELYLGCYRDEDYKERWWNSFEDYDNLDAEYKRMFRASYDTLDINMDELKKLQEATQ